MSFQVFVVRLQIRNRILIPLQGLFGILFAGMLQRLFYRKPLSQALYHFVVILDLTRGSLLEHRGKPTTAFQIGSKWLFHLAHLVFANPSEMTVLDRRLYGTERVSSPARRCLPRPCGA